MYIYYILFWQEQAGWLGFYSLLAGCFSALIIDVKIISHLDTLEHNILQDVDDTEKTIKSKIDNMLQQRSKNSTTVERLQSDIRAVKEYASDLQTRTYRK